MSTVDAARWFVSGLTDLIDRAIAKLDVFVLDEAAEKGKPSHRCSSDPVTHERLSTGDSGHHQ